MKKKSKLPSLEQLFPPRTNYVRCLRFDDAHGRTVGKLRRRFNGKLDFLHAQIEATKKFGYIATPITEQEYEKLMVD